MATEYISRKIHKYFELHKNKNTIYQNLQDIAKIVLKEKFTALNAYTTKEDRLDTNNLDFNLKKLKKEEKIKLKLSKRKE